jgi:hypothetical protein
VLVYKSMESVFLNDSAFYNACLDLINPNPLTIDDWMYHIAQYQFGTMKLYLDPEYLNQAYLYSYRVYLEYELDLKSGITNLGSITSQISHKLYYYNILDIPGLVERGNIWLTLEQARHYIDGFEQLIDRCLENNSPNYRYIIEIFERCFMDVTTLPVEIDPININSNPNPSPSPIESNSEKLEEQNIKEKSSKSSIYSFIIPAGLIIGISTFKIMSYFFS